MEVEGVAYRYTHTHAYNVVYTHPTRPIMEESLVLTSPEEEGLQEIGDA